MKFNLVEKINIFDTEGLVCLRTTEDLIRALQDINKLTIGKRYQIEADGYGVDIFWDDIKHPNIHLTKFGKMLFNRVCGDSTDNWKSDIKDLINVILSDGRIYQ